MGDDVLYYQFVTAIDLRPARHRLRRVGRLRSMPNCLCSVFERRVHIVDVFFVELPAQQLHSLAEALEVYDLSFTQKLDRIVHIRVVREPQDVVIRCPGLLLCCKIFRKIGDGIALDRHGRGRPREARGCCGVYARGVVDKIRIKAALPHLLFGERAGELVNDRANHFQMTQFLSTHIGVKK